MLFSNRSFDYSSKHLIPCVVMDGPPTEKTGGAIGVLCIDKKSGNLYKCVSANYCNNVFTWEIVGEVSDDRIRQSVSDYLEQHPTSGGGFSLSASTILINILRNGVYSADQSANITALAETLAVPEPEQPEEPDEPDAPVVTAHTVTNNLTNVLSSNAAASVTEGASYTATLTAVEGYTLDTVTVIMGGVDITSTVYVDGSINIGTVGGDIVITATAKAEPVIIPMSERHINAANTVIYADDGAEELVASSTCTMVLSEDVFTADTEVTVTIETNGAMYSKMYGACYQPEFEIHGSGEKPLYHAELLFDAWTEVGKAGTYTKTYTVKAGYGLSLVNTANTVTPVTGVTVTK